MDAATIIATASLLAGAGGAAVAYRKVGPERDQIAVQTMREVIEELKGEVQELKSEVGHLKVENARMHGLVSIAGRDFLDSLPGIVYEAEFGRDGRWHYVSPEAYRLTGYDSDCWLEDPRFWLKTIAPADLKKLVADDVRVERMAVPGTTSLNRYKLVLASGREVPVVDRAVVARKGDDLVWRGVIVPEQNGHAWST